MCCSFKLLHLLYDILYYTWSLLISIADPISDLIVALLHFYNDQTVFGIATLAIVLIPGVLLSALSIQWIIYDTTLASKIPDHYSPQDYTHHFSTEQPATDQAATEHGTPENDISFIVTSPVATRNEPDKDEVDVEIHPQETMDTVEVDSNHLSPKVLRSKSQHRRSKRTVTEISVDAGISKYPLIITGITIDRKHAYYKTYEECKIPSVKPSWTCNRNNALSLFCHVLGLPGVPRYAGLLLKSIKVYKKRTTLNEDYATFVKEAKASGIKEVYFNKDLLELSHGRRDAALLRLVEGALEATPQLLLQLYIIVKHTQEDTALFNYVAVATSFVTVTWSMTSYIYEHRLARYDKASLTVFGYACTFAIKFCMCLSRITAILLAAIYSGYMAAGVCTGHWIVCIFYLCSAKTHFYGGLVWSETFFKFITSITLVLTFMNIDEGRSRLRWISYHAFVLVQNLGMLMLWYLDYCTDALNPDWYAIAVVSVVVGGMVLGTLLTLVYYSCLHPSATYVVDVKDIAPVLKKLLNKYIEPEKELDIKFETSL